MAAPERKNALAGAISPACVHFHTLILPFCRLDTSCLWVYGLIRTARQRVYDRADRGYVISRITGQPGNLIRCHTFFCLRQ